MKKRKSKFCCPNCGCDNKEFFTRVKSGLLNKWFCDMNCFTQYKNKTVQLTDNPTETHNLSQN